MATFNNISTFSTDGVWTNTANWSAGTAPADGEEVFVHGGNQSITGVDQSSIELDMLRFAPSWTGNIGSSGNPLWIDATTAYYDANTTAAYLDGIYSKFYFHSPSHADNALVLNATNANTVTTLVAELGKLTVGAACTVTTGVMNPVMAMNSVNVTIASAATITTWIVKGGKLFNNAAMTTMNQYGGHTEHLASTITTVNLTDGKFLPKGGTVTTLNQYGGELDLDQGAGQRSVSTINYYGGVITRRTRGSLGGSITVNAHADLMGHVAGESFTLT